MRRTRISLWLCRAALAAGAAMVALAALILFFPTHDLSAAGTMDRTIFGATYMTMNNPYYQLLDQQIRAGIEAKGDVLISRDAQMDQKRQNEEIGDLIDAGAQLIFLTPVEYAASKEGLVLARQRGVPVIVLDAPVKNAELTAGSILSDNYEAGVLCAQHLLRTKKSAKVLLLEHVTASSGVDRIQGFTDTIKGHDGYRVVGSGQSDGQIENAMPVMEKLLADHPEADTLMALNDPSAFGGMAAIEGAGLTRHFTVYSVDGSPEGKSMVQDGLMTATCAQFPSRVAESAISEGYRVLEGESIPRDKVIPVELITKENVTEYGVDGWQ